jgi:hypothetical protein
MTPFCSECRERNYIMAALDPARTKAQVKRIKARAAATGVSLPLSSKEAIDRFHAHFTFRVEQEDCCVCGDPFTAALDFRCPSGCKPPVCSMCQLQGMVSTSALTKCVFCREINMTPYQAEVCMSVLIPEHSTCDCADPMCVCRSPMVQRYKSEVAAYDACACDQDRRSERLKEERLKAKRPKEERQKAKRPKEERPKAKRKADF